MYRTPPAEPLPLLRVTVAGDVTSHYWIPLAAPHACGTAVTMLWRQGLSSLVKVKVNSSLPE